MWQGTKNKYNLIKINELHYTKSVLLQGVCAKKFSELVLFVCRHRRSIEITSFEKEIHCLNIAHAVWVRFEYLFLKHSCFQPTGRNVALWKPTNQSTTYSDINGKFTSDKAVDGNGDGNFDISKTCTHTLPGDLNSLWNVQLGGEFVLIAINIKNRLQHG